MNLKIDPDRWANKEDWEGAGIYVKAQFSDGTWGIVGISHLGLLATVANDSVIALHKVYVPRVSFTKIATNSSGSKGLRITS